MANRRKHPSTDPEAVMAIILGAIERGDRCPPASAAAFPSAVTSWLARDGRIRVDVYPHNFRVVTVTERGPNFGRQTAPCPNPNWRPYLTLPAGRPSLEGGN